MATGIIIGPPTGLPTGVLSWSIGTTTGNLAPQRRAAWRPQLRSGHMYVGDRSYYLYGRKATIELRDCAWTRFDLPVSIDPFEEIEVKVSGFVHPLYVVDGNSVWIWHFHKDRTAPFWGSLVFDDTEWDTLALSPLETGPDNQVAITYGHKSWDTASNTFITSTVTHSAFFKEGLTEYFVPTVPELAAPVVVTDDKVELHNKRGHVVEFAIDPDDYLGPEPQGVLGAQARLKFNGKQNFVNNSAFCEGSGTAANKWEITDPVTQARIQIEGAYYGKNAVANYSSTGWVQQVAYLPGLGQLNLTAYARSASGIVTGELAANYLGVGSSFLAADGSSLGSVTDDSFAYASTSAEIGTDWSPVTLRLGDDDGVYQGVTGVPSGVTSLLIKLGGDTGGIFWDAVSLTYGWKPVDFVNVHDNITVEYETSPTGLFLYDRTHDFPYDVSNVDANPLNSNAVVGFLAFHDDGYVDDHQLGYGHPTGVENTNEWMVNLGSTITDAQLQVVPGLKAVSHTNPAGLTGDGYYAWLPIGRVTESDTIWSTPFVTPAAVSYTGGIQNETWVGSPVASGVYPIDLQTDAHRASWLDVLNYQLGTVTGALTFTGLIADTYDFLGRDSLWSKLATELHDLIPADWGYGLAGGHQLYSDSLAYSPQLAGITDTFVVEGLARDRSLVRTDKTKRSRLVAGVYDVLTKAAENGQLDTTTHALDFAIDPRDTEVINVGRFESHKHYWDHHAAYTDWSTVGAPSGEVYVPYNTLYGIPYDASTGMLLGRRHFPYSRTDGVGKMAYRATFHSMNSQLEEPSAYVPVEQKIHKILTLPSEVAYRDSFNKIHNIVRIGDTHKMGAMVLDENSSPMDGVRVHITASDGLMSDVPFGITDVTELVKVTDRGGVVYVDYRYDGVPGTGIANLLFESLRDSVSNQVQIDAS